MLPWRIFSIGLALLLLASCGNKGELFLVPTEITDEQLESIDEAIEAIDQEAIDQEVIDQEVIDQEDDLSEQLNEDSIEDLIDDPTENKKKNNES